MNLSFWKQVMINWQSLQLGSVEGAVDIERFHNVLLKDISKVKEKESSSEVSLEITNDDDFWGDL